LVLFVAARTAAPFVPVFLVLVLLVGGSGVEYDAGRDADDKEDEATAGFSAAVVVTTAFGDTDFVDCSEVVSTAVDSVSSSTTTIGVTGVAGVVASDSSDCEVDTSAVVVSTAIDRITGLPESVPGLLGDGTAVAVDAAVAVTVSWCSFFC
jgi:hypothetical protein